MEIEQRNNEFKLKLAAANTAPFSRRRSTSNKLDVSNPQIEAAFPSKDWRSALKKNLMLAFKRQMVMCPGDPSDVCFEGEPDPTTEDPLEVAAKRTALALGDGETSEHWKEFLEVAKMWRSVVGAKTREARQEFKRKAWRAFKEVMHVTFKEFDKESCSGIPQGEQDTTVLAAQELMRKVEIWGESNGSGPYEEMFPVVQSVSTTAWPNYITLCMSLKYLDS